MTERHPLTDPELIALRHGTPPEPARAALAARLGADAAGRATVAEWDRQDTALAALYGPIAAEPLPETLRTMLDRAAREDAAPRHRAALPKFARLAAAVLLLALGAAGGWTAARLTPGEGAAVPVALAAIRAHQTFAVEVAHPVEVAATEAEHLTRWLSKRLGHPIAAPDFASFGFALMGGRILPTETGAAAVFMYENATGQRITLYAAAGDGSAETAFRFVEAGATQGFWWIDGSLRYAVVGEVPREALRAIATVAWQQLT
ncbi:MAG: hypothetical protein Q8Q63_15135 [Phaeovulum sp.]|nr:hypothetical protein [Phaeovulum sp.]MDP2064076.1 hypothetical protein [Phaeovulum sp.]MDP3862909.1 hypothetical protein [Phaeovulum sp.]